jgi:hypothetical protein
MQVMTEEDRELDALWRERFGEPLPILGAGKFVREVLEQPEEFDPLPRAA